MTTVERGWLFVTIAGLLPFLFVFLFVVVQLITYAYLTAKHRFEQSHKPNKEQSDNGHE